MYEGEQADGPETGFPSTRRMSARARHTLDMPIEMQSIIWSWYIVRLRVRLFLYILRHELSWGVAGGPLHFKRVAGLRRRTS